MPKQAILENIRRSLRRQQALDDSVVDGLQLRLNRRQPLVQHVYDEDPVERLLRKHDELKGSVSRIEQSGAIVEAVLDYLSRNDLPAEILTSNLDLLNQLDWGEARLDFRSAEANDGAILSVARCAVAETGTLVLVSSAATPMSHNYLPDHHIVLVRESTVVRYQEDVWALLRQDDNFPPRAIAMVSGPSKTGDVEQTIEYGAHGPRSVHMILWQDRDSPE